MGESDTSLGPLSGLVDTHSQIIDQSPHPERRGCLQGGVNCNHYVREVLKVSHSVDSITPEPLAARVQDR